VQDRTVPALSLRQPLTWGASSLFLSHIARRSDYSMSQNVIQQLGNVPVQTPFTTVDEQGKPKQNGGITLGWMQWFQALFNAVKTIPQPSVGTPTNPAVIAGYQTSVNEAGQTIYIPYYQ
jgi:hypothetical protein